MPSRKLMCLKKTLPLALALASSPLMADGGSFFDLFSEDFTPTYDLVVKKLDYTKQHNSVGAPSGLFSFQRFKMIGEEVSVNLDNGDGYFDSQIYVANNLIGFQGPLAQFAYRLRPEDFKYFDSFEWLKLDNLEFKMDREEIHLQGERFTMQEPRTFLLAQNFNLDCERHSSYLLNNGDGFLSGCLNSSLAGGLNNSEAFAIDYKLKSLEGNSYDAQVSGTFTHFSAHQDHFSIRANRVDADFKETTQILAKEIEMSCSKKEDLMTINEEELLTPCLEDIAVKSRRVTLDIHSKEREGEIDNIDIIETKFTHSPDNTLIEAGFFDYRSTTTNFKTNAVKIACDPANGNPDDIGSYIQTCLESGEFTSLNRSSLNMELTIDEPKKDDVEAFYLNLKGDVEGLSTNEESMRIRSSKMELDIDRDLFMTINDTNWNCNKKLGHREFDVENILGECKDDSQIDIDNIYVKNFVNPEDPTLFLIKPDTITSTDNRIRGNIPNLTMISTLGVKFFEDLNISCQKMPEADLFKLVDVIEGCANNSYITLDKLFTAEVETKAKHFIENRVNIYQTRNTIDKPGVTDVKVDVTNGQINVTLKAKVMGMKPTVQFSGTVKWDKEKKLLTIKVRKLKLPLILNSKTLFRMVLRNLVDGEMISVNSETEIRVQL